MARLLTIGLATAAALAALAVCAPRAALAATSKTSGVGVTIPVVLQVTYTGSSTITFNVTKDDVRDGFKELDNQGNINWWANKQPWAISVVRTYFFRNGQQAEDDDFGLQVRTHTTGATAWFVVNRTAVKWIHGTVKGTGTYSTVDWYMIIGDGDSDDKGLATGTYTTTVTFTIALE